MSIYTPDDGLLYQVVNGGGGADNIDGTVINPPDGTVAIENLLIRGMAGNDHLVGGYGEDWITGGTGDDYLGGTTPPTVANGAYYGDDGADRLFGNAGNDVINDPTVARAEGGVGNDRIITEVNGDPGQGTSHLNGGDGHDTFALKLANGSAGFFVDDEEDSVVRARSEIQDFNRAQGDHLKLTATSDEVNLSSRQLFHSLDTNHSGSLSAADGDSQFGSVSHDAEGLHVRFGHCEVELLDVGKLNAADFIFG